MKTTTFLKIHYFNTLDKKTSREDIKMWPSLSKASMVCRACTSVSSVWSEHILKKRGVGGWGCNVTREMLFGKHSVVVSQTQTESEGKISVQVLQTACEKWASSQRCYINVYKRYAKHCVLFVLLFLKFAHCHRLVIPRVKHSFANIRNDW